MQQGPWFRRALLQRVASATLAAGVVFGAPKGAFAFCRSTTAPADSPVDRDGCKLMGQSLYWPTGCVGVSLNSDGTSHLAFNDISGAFDKAIRTWSDVTCSDGSTAAMRIFRLRDSTCDRTETLDSGPNVNVVMFRDLYWVHGGDQNTVAFTTVSFTISTGEILGADIELNSAKNKFVVSDNVARDEVDLQSILTHEMGHFLGMAHSPLTDATMYAYYTNGTTNQRDLTADDIEGICNVYPPNSNATCDPTPHGGFKESCSPIEQPAQSCALGAPTSPSPGWFLLAALPLARLRRRVARGRR